MSISPMRQCAVSEGDEHKAKEQETTKRGLESIDASLMDMRKLSGYTKPPHIIAGVAKTKIYILVIYP